MESVCSKIPGSELTSDTKMTAVGKEKGIDAVCHERATEEKINKLGRITKNNISEEFRCFNCKYIKNMTCKIWVYADAAEFNKMYRKMKLFQYLIKLLEIDKFGSLVTV